MNGPAEPDAVAADAAGPPTIAAARPPRPVSYWCANHHHTRLRWSAGAKVPEVWDCPHCGLPAGRDATAPPPPPAYTPFRSPLEYLLQRRTKADCEALLAEALDNLRVRRGAAVRDGPHGPRDRPPRGR